MQPTSSSMLSLIVLLSALLAAIIWPLVGHAAERSIYTNASFRAQVIDLTNQERARVGCDPLVEDGRLTLAAQRYSDEMAQTGNFSHIGADGSTFVGRLRAVGYRFRIAGENLGYGQLTAQEVVHDWMLSPGHRRNLLNCGYRAIGVGVSFPDNDYPYWVQDMAAPR